ncbi:MAG: sulfur carrier protein ThiS [Hyphomonas sp.]
MNITLNGEALEIEAGTSIAQLVHRISGETGRDPRGVAVERNLEIVPRSAYGGTLLSEGDAIEIVHFIGGG